jgi:RecJ-like exonuclease
MTTSTIEKPVEEKVEEETVCEFCEGTGEVTCAEWDEDAHIYMPVGTEKCICQLSEPEDENDQDR